MASYCMETLSLVAEPFLGAMHLHRHDDDLIDKINHKASTIFIFSIVFLHTFYQFFIEKVIHCWTPPEFPLGWVEYTNAHCWIKNTYYIPPTEEDVLNSERRQILYYQWVPFMLATVGMLSYVPGLVWYVGAKSSGLNVNTMVLSVKELSGTVNPNVRDKKTRGLASHIDRALMLIRERTLCNKVSRCSNAKLRCGGCTLAVLWITTKLLYILCVGVQMFSLYKIIGIEYLTYGVMMIKQVFIMGTSPLEIRIFPKVTLCDFEVRSIGKAIPYTVECNLPINIFNAKIFLILWYWLVLIQIINIIGFAYGISKFTRMARLQYFQNMLKCLDEYSKEDRFLLNSFVTHYLMIDGYIAIRLLAGSIHQVAAAEVIQRLWSQYKIKSGQPRPSPADSFNKLRLRTSKLTT